MAAGRRWALTGARPGAEYRISLYDPRTGRPVNQTLCRAATTGALTVPPLPDAQDWVVSASLD